LRKAVKEANPEAVILAEHYGSSRDWLNGDEWDTLMNYDAFMEPLTWFLTGMQKHSDDSREDLYGNVDSFWGAMNHHGTNFTMPSLYSAMNELSNHDHSRFLTRTNRKVGRMHTLGCRAAEEGVNKAVLREAVLVQMTWPGSPTIYYGDEAGLCGFTDPDNRRTYPWGREDHDLIAFHKAAIRVHKENPVLRHGSLIRLGGDYNFLAFGRFDRKDAVVVILNNNNHEIDKEVSVWEAGICDGTVLSRQLLSYENGFTTETCEYIVEQGKINIHLSAVSGVILKAVRN